MGAPPKSGSFRYINRVQHRRFVSFLRTVRCSKKGASPWYLARVIWGRSASLLIEMGPSSLTWTMPWIQISLIVIFSLNSARKAEGGPSWWLQVVRLTRTSVHAIPEFNLRLSGLRYTISPKSSNLTSYPFILNPVQKNHGQISYWTNRMPNREAVGETRCRFKSVIFGAFLRIP